MTSEMVLFYILAGGAVLSSAAMLLPTTGRNPIHAAMALIVSFFFLAALYAMLSAHLLTAIQIIVYAGAVMVLFTFVIMLLNLAPEDMPAPRITVVKVIGGGIGLFIFGKLTTAITLASAGAQAVDLSAPGYETYGGVKEVGRMLYTSFLVPFELTSVLLLVAAVGAVVLAKKTLNYVEHPEPPPGRMELPHNVAAAVSHDDAHAGGVSGHDSHGGGHH